MLFSLNWFRAGMPALLVVGALLPALPYAVAAENTLNLAQAQRIAVERSLQLQAQDAAAAASREMAVAAGQLPDPVLRLGVDNLPAEGADRFNLTRDFMTQRRIGVSQEFPREQKRLLRAERFEREAERNQTDKDALQVAIRRDTALAWLDRHYARLSGAIIVEQADSARLELQAAEAAYRAGRGSQADVIAARAELVMLDDRMSEVVRRGRGAQAALSRWVGDAAEWPLQGRPAIDTIALDPGNLEVQLAQHPQIAAIARQEAIVATEVKLARANRTPDWSAELSYSQRGPAYSNMISFGVSIPLQWDRSNRQDREVASRLALLDQARAQRQDALRAYVAEVRKLIADWESGRERRARYERELIPLAVQRSQAMLAAYRGGKTSLAEVLASRRAEIDLRLQALQIEAETAQAWARLNFLAIQSGAVTAVVESAEHPIRETK